MGKLTKALDSRTLGKHRDRLTDWGLGRSVDEYLAQNQERPDLCKPSVLAKWLMERPEVRGSIGKATIRAVDVQVHLYQRRMRQEANADAMLMDGPNGKKLTNIVADRVSKFVEYSGAIELMMPETMAIAKELNKKAIECAKLGKELPKGYKTAWQVVKTNLDLMEKAVKLIKGDNTLMNIIKAQTVTTNIIRGINPEELPGRMLDLLQNVKCPKCGHDHWTKREALGAYARAKGSEAKKEIIDAKMSPVVPTPEEIDDDPAGEFWEGEYESRK